MSKVVMWFFTSTLFLNVSYAQKEYTPDLSDPFTEPWRWTKLDELSDKSVSLVKEHNGVIWFAGSELISYDGYFFKYYNYNEVIVGNTIVGMDFIGDFVYIATINSLARFNKKTTEFETIFSPNKKELTRLVKIEAVNDSITLLLTSHGFVIMQKNRYDYITLDKYINAFDTIFRAPNFKIHPVLQETVFGIKQVVILDDNKVDFYANIGNKGKGVGRFKIIPNDSVPVKQLKTPKFKSMPKYDLGTCRAVDTNGNTYFVSSKANFGVNIFTNGKWQHFRLGKLFGGNDKHGSIQILADNTVIIGAFGEIYVEKNGIWKKYSSRETPITSSRSIEVCYAGNDKLIIGGAKSEFFLVDISEERYKLTNGLLYQCTDNHGHEWYISENNEAVVLANKVWLSYGVESGLPDHINRIFVSKNGNIWCFGSHNLNAATAIFKDNKWNKKVHKEMAWGIPPESFLLAEDGQIYLGYSGPLGNGKPGSNILRITDNDIDNIDYNYIKSSKTNAKNLIYQHNGTIYATEQFKTFMVDGQELIPSTKIHQVRTTAVANKPDGETWIGTEGNGLHIFKNDEKINRDQSNGLLSNSITAIGHSPNADIAFVATDKDISMHKNGKWINSILPEDYKLETWGGLLSVDNSDYLWLTKYSRKWATRALNDETYNENKEALLSLRFGTDTIPPKTQFEYYDTIVDQLGNTVISWIGKDFWHGTTSNQLLHSTKLNDEKWSDFSTTKQKRFMNLSHGKYSFSVRTMDKDGNIEIAPKTINFKVLPPIWMRPWFIAMIVVFILITTYLIRNIIVRNKKLAENNRDLQEQKEEIVAQNEEIQQQAEELEAQKDALAESHEALEGSFKRFEMLSEFGQKITATLDIDSIYNMIFDYASSVIDISAFGIGLYDEIEELIYYPKFIDGEKVEENVTKSLKDKKSLTSLCFNKQEVIFINDIEHDAEKYGLNVKEMANIASARSRIHIPLTVESKKMGLLVFNSSKANAYSKEDLTNMQTLASYISIALDNAKAYDTIHDINKNTEKSINYASTIQNAFLPQPIAINDYINAFVLFKPKDIVSGDFYWFLPIENDSSKPIDVFIAAMDCTGHGVPGALMSMVGNNLLRETVKILKIYNPAEILKALNEGIKGALKQEATGNNDGMDASLVRIQQTDNENFNVHFGGAKNPLIIIRQDGSLDSIKGSRASIGGAKLRKEKVFEQQEITLKKGDQIYLFTDGYSDQNGPDREKFGRENMLKLLQENAHLNMPEQQQKLEEALSVHQQKSEQRDDITILGIKL